MKIILICSPTFNCENTDAQFVNLLKQNAAKIYLV